MGLFKLLGAPVTAPIHAGRKLLDTLLEQAEQQYYNESEILKALSDLETAHRLGQLNDEQFELREEQLLQRWAEARAYHAGRERDDGHE